MSCYTRACRSTLTDIFRNFDSVTPIYVLNKHVYGYYPNVIRGYFRVYCSPIYTDKSNPLELKQWEIEDAREEDTWVITTPAPLPTFRGDKYSRMSPYGIRPVYAEDLLDKTRKVTTINKIGICKR